MSFKWSLLCIVLIAHFPFIATAGMLKGRISDEKGEPLPYASIYIKGTTTGTASNASGHYELSLAPGTYKVVCQYVGFNQVVFNITITENETIQHDFKLQEQHLEMKEVVIHAGGEDPAYRVIRNAIKKRTEHLQQVKSFQTGIYMKGVVRVKNLPDKIFGQKISQDDRAGSGLDSVGKGVIYICEEDATYYSSGSKEHTMIHSVREGGDPQGTGLNRMLPVITFYENNVNVLTDVSRGFISPIGDNALFYYRYKMQGTFIRDGHKIYKIQVTPKREYEPLFTGTIYIADEDWSIQGTDMLLTKTAGLSQLDTIHIEQTYLPLKKNTWVIQQQVFTLGLSIFGIAGGGVFVTAYSKQKVNEPIPDSIFNSKIVSMYDKTATDKDTSYWKGRPLPLEGDEIKYYRFSDSVYTITNSAAYIDSLRRHANKGQLSSFLTDDLKFTSKNHINVISVDGLLSLVNYNTVEGVTISPASSWVHRIDTGKRLQVDVGLRYGFSNTHFNAIGRVSYFYDNQAWMGRRWMLGIEGGKYVFQYSPARPVKPFYNTIATLLFARNPLKIYERKELAVTAARNYGNGFSWKVKAGWQQRMPLENTTDYSFNKNLKFTDNLPDQLKYVTVWERHDAALVHIGLSYQPGYRYIMYPKYMVGYSSQPVFSIDYDKGIPDVFNSKVDFDKWRAGVQGGIGLKLLGRIAYNISAGGFLNTNYVSVPDLKHLNGNYHIGIAANYLNSFQLLGFYDYSNKETLYGEAHVEYNLLGFISNKVPFMKRARWSFVVGNNTFFVSSNNYYTEVSIGIDNIGWKFLRLGRVDFVQAWNSAGGKNSGVRLGLDVPGARKITATGSRESSEW